MYAAALFVIAETWKQPKCPPFCKWMSRLWFLHAVGLLLSNEKKQTRDACIDVYVNIHV